MMIILKVNEPNPSTGSPGELLSKRCVTLIKTVLKPEVWKQGDLKIQWFDKLFASLDSPQVINTQFKIWDYFPPREIQFTFG